MLEVISTLIRHALTLIAGGLITDGYLTETNIQAISGAVLTIGVIAWSIIEKKYFKKS